MTMTDPIADLLTRIRNAQVVKHDRLDVPMSRVKHDICKILKEQGYIEDFEVHEGSPRDTLRIFLRYLQSGEPSMQVLQRVSRPGRRVYRGADELRPVRQGIGISIVSTSQGVLTDSEARDKRVGGEVLCEIW